MDEVLPAQVDSLAGQMRTEADRPAIVERPESDAGLTPAMKAAMLRATRRR